MIDFEQQTVDMYHKKDNMKRLLVNSFILYGKDPAQCRFLPLCGE
jgi:hypothetical protein